MIQMKPEVSVITRAYNEADIIERALNSVLNQTFDPKQYEIVVIDDGSIDDTDTVVSNYEQNHPSTVRFFRTGDTGPIASLNEGIERARGMYITVLDADDRFEPSFLERTYSVIQKRTEVDFVYTDYYEITSDGKKKYVDTSEDLFQTVAAGIIFNKEAIEAIGGYDETLVFPEYDLLIKLHQRGRKGCHIAEPLFVYYRRNDSITANEERVTRGKHQLKERYGDNFDFREY
jgi:glycosyltransferase involved in cell wall biosynthesis